MFFCDARKITAGIVCLVFLVPSVSAEIKVQKTYYPGGALKAEFVMKDGRLDGPTKWYYESGALGAVLEYRQNKLHGLTKVYYENGVLKKMVPWNENRPVGVSKYYAENGSLLFRQIQGRDGGVSRWHYDAKGRISHCEELTAHSLVNKSISGVQS